MGVGNIRRGFNRLFLVLTVVWVIYCTVVYPFNQGEKADARFQTEVRDCYEHKAGQGEASMYACLNSAGEEYRATAHQWVFQNFYSAYWPLILAAVTGVPLLVYGAVRGLAAISAWIWRGYSQPRVGS